MKYLILAALVVGLITMASGVFAYEFSEHECQVEADSWQRMQDQRRLDQNLTGTASTARAALPAGKQTLQPASV